MKKNKMFLIICCGLTVIGLCLIFTGFLFGGRIYGIGLNRTGFHVYTPQDPYGDGSSPENIYEEKEITLDAFQNMEIDSDYIDLSIIVSDHYGIDYKINTGTSHLTYAVEEGVLKLEQKKLANSGRAAINWFSFITPEFPGNTNKPEYITVYLPKDAIFDNTSLISDVSNIKISDLHTKDLNIRNSYRDIDIKNVSVDNSIDMQLDTCSVNMDNVDAGMLTLQSSYRDIYLKNIKINNDINMMLDTCSVNMDNVAADMLALQSSYRDIYIKNVTVNSDLNMTLDTCSVDMDNVDADMLTLQSSYRDIYLTDINIKNDLEMKLDTCPVSIKETESGTLTIQNSYRDIRADSLSIDSLKINLDSGDCTLNNLSVNNADIILAYGNADIVPLLPLTSYNCELSADYGDIYIDGRETGNTYNSTANDSEGRYIRISADSGDIEISNR